MIEENVVRAAGASYCMDEVEIVRNIEDAGFVPRRRNMHYEILGEPYLPRARGPAHDDAGDGARGRSGRHGGRARELSGAKPRRQGAASEALITYRARWVLPIASPPISERVGRGRQRTRRKRLARTDDRCRGHRRRPMSISGAWRLLPGLVNAHTHLELCWMAGAVPPATRFTDWVRAMMSSRREQPDAAIARHPRSVAPGHPVDACQRRRAGR